MMSTRQSSCSHFLCVARGMVPVWVFRGVQQNDLRAGERGVLLRRRAFVDAQKRCRWDVEGRGKEKKELHTDVSLPLLACRSPRGPTFAELWSRLKHAERWARRRREAHAPESREPDVTRRVCQRHRMCGRYSSMMYARRRRSVRARVGRASARWFLYHLPIPLHGVPS